MALKMKTELRNARGNVIESTIGAAAILRMYHLAAATIPAAVTDAATGTKFFDDVLPSDWFGAFSGGVGNHAGTWEDTSADADADIETDGAYWRIYAADGTTCWMQGTVGCPADPTGHQIVLNANSLTAGQSISPVTMTITEGNA